MDLIKISDTKLKIMLTASDMTYYELHNDSISIADAHVRSVLRRLLEDAREKTGFDSDISHLYVQMYPCVDGGCELFISKPNVLKQNDDCCNLPALPEVAKQGRSLRAPERHGIMCTYSFSSLKDVIAVCKRLKLAGFNGESRAFVDHTHTFYLTLSGVSAPSLYSPDEFCFLGEYGNRENGRVLQTYLHEYCTTLCTENAVQIFMQL